MPRILLSRALPVLAALALTAGCRDSTASDAGTLGRFLDPEERELLTPVDPNAPEERREWVQWIRRAHEPIRSLTSTEYGDLRFLEGVLAGKRVVQLGESSHGVREFNQAKVRLIRYLHEEQGFDVIAFESGLYECSRANGSAPDVDPYATMRNCIFGVWHTEEVRELFEYIKETRATGRPLILAGFDIQVSSGLGTQSAPAFLQQTLSSVDSDYAQRAWRLERDYRTDMGALRAADAQPGSDFAPLRRLVPAYDSLVAFIDANLAALTAANGGNAERVLVARQLAFSRRQEIELWSHPDVIQRHLAREVGMADNLDALLDRIHPGKKVMVWAHNYHIQHDRASLVPGSGAPPEDLGDFNTMGHFVHQRRGAELYTVGLFMYRGQAVMSGDVHDVTEAAPGSVESLGYRVRKKHFFVDLAGASGPGSDWTRSTVMLKDQGIWDMGQVPAEQFDGILFIDTVTPPDYID